MTILDTYDDFNFMVILLFIYLFIFIFILIIINNMKHRRLDQDQIQQMQ